MKVFFAYGRVLHQYDLAIHRFFNPKILSWANSAKDLDTFICANGKEVLCLEISEKTYFEEFM